MISTMLDRCGEQGGVVDVDVIRRYPLASQFEDVGEGKGDQRAVVAGISDFPLTAGRSCPAPDLKQLMSA